MLSHGTMLMRVTCTTIWGHIDDHSPSVLLFEAMLVSIFWVMLVSVARVALEATLMSLACATIKNYNGISGLCFSRGPC